MRITLGARRRALAIAEADYDDALPSLEQLAQQQRFDEIIEILQFQRRLEPWLCVPNSNNTTALHVIMPYDPPVALVDLVIQSLARLSDGDGCYIPEAAVEATLGQTPLHLAAAYGCDVEMLQRLTKMSHHAVLTRDVLGRLPLHWVVVSCCSGGGGTKKTSSPRGDKGKQSKSSRSRKKYCISNTINSIHHLVDIYPHSCSVHDDNGRSPLDLAIQYKADQRIILALLHKAQQTVMKYGAAPGCGPASVATPSTLANSVVPPRSVVVMYANESQSDDDVSSLGARTRFFRHRSSPRKSSTMAEF